MTAARGGHDSCHASRPLLNRLVAEFLVGELWQVVANDGGVPHGDGGWAVTGFEQPSRTAAADRLPYLALLGLGALDAAGYSVIAPVIPAVAAATGAGPALIGALVASFPTGMLVGFYLAGHGVLRQRSQAVLL